MHRPPDGILAEGFVGIGTSNPGARLEVDTNAAGTKGLLIKGHSGQSTNLLEIQNSSASVLVSVDSAGTVKIGNWTILGY